MSDQQLTALQLADMIERYNAGVHSQVICENYSLAAAELRRLHAENTELRAALAQQPATPEPFGYFRAEPFGWTDCAPDDEGAIPLYEHPSPRVPELTGEMVNAAHQYLNRFKHWPGLPDQFRWHELWAAMLAAKEGGAA